MLCTDVIDYINENLAHNAVFILYRIYIIIFVKDLIFVHLLLFNVNKLVSGSNENLISDQPFQPQQQQQQTTNESTEHLKRLFCDHFKIHSEHADLRNDFKSLLKDLTLDFDSLNAIFQVNFF